MIALQCIGTVRVRARARAIARTGKQVQPVVVRAEQQRELLCVGSRTEILRLRRDDAPVIGITIDRHLARTGVQVERESRRRQFDLERGEAACERTRRGDQCLFLPLAQQHFHLTHDQQSRERQRERQQCDEQEFEAQGHGIEDPRFVLARQV